MYVLTLKEHWEVQVVKGEAKEECHVRMVIVETTPSTVKIGFEAPADVSIRALDPAKRSSKPVFPSVQQHRRWPRFDTLFRCRR